MVEEHDYGEYQVKFHNWNDATATRPIDLDAHAVGEHFLLGAVPVVRDVAVRATIVHQGQRHCHFGGYDAFLCH